MSEPNGDMGDERKSDPEALALFAISELFVDLDTAAIRRVRAWIDARYVTGPLVHAINLESINEVVALRTEVERLRGFLPDYPKVKQP